MPVRIESLRTTPVGLPFRRRYLTAAGALDRREMIVVRLRTDDGTTGYGDAVPLSLRGGRGLVAVRSDIERICAPALIGSDLSSTRSSAALGEIVSACRSAGAGAQAASGVGIALLDLAGKLHGLPAWSLLGAESQSPVQCNGTIGMEAPDDAAGAASELATAGFKTLKIKVGNDADLDRLRAVRSAAGPEMKLRVDANGAWSVAEAIDLLGRLTSTTIELAEQPCPTIEDLAAVRIASTVPIVADESVTDTRDAAEATEIGAIDAATLKLAKVGGFDRALAIDDLVPSYLSSALDSAIGIAAAAHTAQAMHPRQFATALDHGLATSGLFTDNVADDGSLLGPSIQLTGLPGLGIDVDETAIERLRLP